MTDSALEELLFPSDKSATDRRLPDYNYICKELLRNGVTKKLLWIEYCEECRQAGEEPLMYSQFCEYIRRDEQKRRATMHIPGKPGEQIEVDWAGDPRTSSIRIPVNSPTAGCLLILLLCPPGGLHAIVETTSLALMPWQCKNRTIPGKTCQSPFFQHGQQRVSVNAFVHNMLMGQAAAFASQVLR
jgi:hypothetical protein